MARLLRSTYSSVDGSSVDTGEVIDGAEVFGGGEEGDENGDEGDDGDDAEGTDGNGHDKEPTGGFRWFARRDKQKFEDWQDSQATAFYKASLANEVPVDRERWLFYIDPVRQQQRAKRGLPPSVIVGIDSIHRNPFKEARRRMRAKKRAAEGKGLSRTHSLENRRRLRDGLGEIPMLYPVSRFPVCLGLVVGVMDCTYSAFFIPVTTVFEIPLTSWNWVTITDFVAAILFTTDMVAAFSTGLVVVYNLQQAVVMDRRMVAKHYVVRGTFVIDLLATAPLWVEIFVVAVYGQRASQDVLNILNVLRCFRLLRLIRVARAAIRQSFMPTAVKWLPNGLGYFLNLSFTAALFINILGCIWYYTARVEDIGAGGTWLSYAGNGDNSDLKNAPKTEQFVAAIYWATTTIATVGYGDITPVTTAERIVAMVMMLLGVMFFGFLIGAVGEYLESASSNAQSGRLFRSKMEGVDRWMEARNLPRKTRAQITQHFSDIWTRHMAYHDSSFFTDLPVAIRVKVARMRIRTPFTRSQLGQALGPGGLLVMSAAVLPTGLQPGHELCQQGAPGDRLWFLSEGSVLAIKLGESIVRVTAPAVLGEGALLAALADAPALRPMTYRATTSCFLWELLVDDVLRLKALRPTLLEDVSHYFLKVANQRLRELDDVTLYEVLLSRGFAFD